MTNDLLGSREAPAVELLRLGGSAFDVLGVLRLGGRAIAVTVEPPWKDNAPNVSCIPLGVYLCVRTISQRHGDTFVIIGVPGRSGVVFHSGNSVLDTEGCVILGASLGVTRSDGLRTVVGSRIARDRFCTELAGVRQFWLSVTTLPDIPAVIAGAVRSAGRA